uniref:Uncharacterized protein n=1 Tax=Panagrolaimus sp. ES5 TaxID=591445 RepID=A0AC34GHN2_9BILA
YLYGFYMNGGYHTPLGFDDIETPTFIIGRIINRNGQTLMEEGRPYTPQDNCIYFSRPLTVYRYIKPLKGSYVITSEFCCTSFKKFVKVI